jgi:hypothetical protein
MSFYRMPFLISNMTFLSLHLPILFLTMQTRIAKIALAASRELYSVSTLYKNRELYGIQSCLILRPQ